MKCYIRISITIVDANILLNTRNYETKIIQALQYLSPIDSFHLEQRMSKEFIIEVYVQYHSYHPFVLE